MNIGMGSVLFLGKADDAHVERAAAYCRLLCADVQVCLGRWGDPLPAAVDAWKGDLVISYLSRWILSEAHLNQAKLAINFHPGPPEYPGYGCNNFAIYDDAREYGVTCHHMAPRVDTGPVIATRRFPVFPADDAETLLARAYDCQLVLFYEIIGHIARGEVLPESPESWTRSPSSRKELDALRVLSVDMDRAEIERRVRATAIGPYGPELELHGFTFELKKARDG
jgi:methionyl-tRNA formyltransferase